jgi:hypothetical protein
MMHLDKIAPFELMRQLNYAAIVSDDRSMFALVPNRRISMHLREPNAFGALLLVASIAILLVGLFHPETRGETLDEVAHSLAENATADRIVHGTVAALLAAILIAYVDLGYRIGFGYTSVRCAVSLGILSIVAMIGIPIVDGVVLPSLAERYVQADAAGQIEGFRSLLRLVAIGVVPTLTMSAAICFAASTLSWCIAFRVSTFRSQVLVVLGCVLAVMSIVGVAASFGPIVLKVCLLLWNISVAIVWLKQDSSGVTIERSPTR